MLIFSTNYHFQLIIGDKNDATEYVLTFFNITKTDYLNTCAISLLIHLPFCCTMQTLTRPKNLFIIPVGKKMPISFVATLYLLFFL